MGICSYTWKNFEKEKGKLVEKRCPRETWERSERFCIFHDPSPEKNLELFKKKLEEQVQSETEKHDFFGYYFPENWDFSNLQLEIDADFRETTFQNANLRGATFQNADFRGATFYRSVNFKDAAFQYAVFKKVSFQDAYFVKATFQNVDFRAATFENTNFKDVTFQNVDFRGATFNQGVNFRGATFNQGVNFRGATFNQGVNFRGATFNQGVNFKEVIFQNADFRGTNFQTAYFVRATFQTANFRGATFFRNVDFRKTIFLKNADFRGATFQNAYFKEVTFQDADFKRADFQKKSVFISKVIRRLDLRNTEFLLRSKMTTDLTETMFHGAFIENIAFVDCIWPDNHIIYEENHMKDEEMNLSYGQLETIYRNLKQNMQNHGDYKTAGEFYYREMEMRRKGTKTKRNRLWLELYHFLAGYGEKPQLVVRNAFLVIFLMAVLFLFNGVVRVGIETPLRDESRIIDYSIDSISPSTTALEDFGYCLYYSVVTFTTLGYGDIHPLGNSHILASIEALIGAFFMALFVVVFARKMMR